MQDEPFKDLVPQIKALYLQNKTPVEIGHALGVTHFRVLNILRVKESEWSGEEVKCWCGETSADHNRCEVCEGSVHDIIKYQRKIKLTGEPLEWRHINKTIVAGGEEYFVCGECLFSYYTKQHGKI